MLIFYTFLMPVAIAFSQCLDEQNPPIGCGVNEEYYKCKISCPPKFCNISYTEYACTEEYKCEPGCDCKENYLRDTEGICVLNEDCPPPPPPIICGDNEIESICIKTCPPDSCDFDLQLMDCRPSGCVRGCNCIDNYLRDSNGKCIPKEQCPKNPLSCDGNATYIDCPSPCPSTCQSPNERYCKKKCEAQGCQCNPSYLLSKINGECILPKDCPDGYPCSQNETFVPCNVRCPDSYCPIDDSRAIIACDPPYPCPSGCSCKLNYKRKSVTDPRCILIAECPPVKCTRPNEEWNTCPTSCLKENCDDLNIQDTACRPSMLNCQPRCTCKEGFYRNKSGTCVSAEECFPKKTCDVPYECRSTCAEPNPRNCDHQSTTENIHGCKCKPGFVLTHKHGKCVKIENCPPQSDCNGDKNATLAKCPPPCPATCQSPYETPCKMKCLDAGCKCKDGFILSKLNGVCIEPSQCPGGNPCGTNATFASCNNKCPYNYCPVDDSPPNYTCLPPEHCPSGCICKLNHRKKTRGSNECILSSDCPPVNCTRPNEVWSPCPSACLRESCQDAGKKPTVCNTLVLNCQPKCICKPDTYRDKNNICVPVEECPPPPIVCGENEVATNCKKNCPPDTCEMRNQVQFCKRKDCQRGCDCIENYFRDSNGKCIPKEQCSNEQMTCDNNSTYISCPSPCPSSCQAPNEGFCKKQCQPNGCQCKPSYLLSKPKGQCILPQDCSDGYPCPQNETFVACNIQCPNSYCPVDDRLGILICDPPLRCPSGCSCKLNYKRKSVKDRQCILATECPPVKCTRPNEEWNTCPTSCLKENCNDLKLKNTACKPSRTNCQPRCACKEGFYRNESRICVPASECFPTDTCDIPNECRATCAQPNPKNCPYVASSENIKGCKCQPGYILSEKNGDCVKVEDCPPQTACNGDSNARIAECPPPCPSTCQFPNEAPCKKKCLDVGCKCKDGFILSELNGICIPPKNCSGGDPCGINATFLSCNSNCLYNYCPVDDSPTDYTCSPPPNCPSGCVCNINHRKKSIGETECILSSECPPVNCTRPNEVWDPCPSDCLQENCEDADKEPSTCNTFLLNCQPKCVCKPNTFRDENKICIPVEECRNKKEPVPCDDDEEDLLYE